MNERDVTRRDFLKEAATMAAAAAALAETHASAAPPADPAKLPAIKLGKLEVSRLVLGSNPFFGFSHEPAENRRMKAWYTHERIMQVMDRAAEVGITAVAAPPYSHWIELFRKYLDKGGKLRIWIAQPDADSRGMKRAIAAAGKGGAKAVFVQGTRTDQQFGAGRFDALRAWVEQIKRLGLPAGLASHRPDVHLEIERRKLPTDFYFQCFYNPGRYHAEDRRKAVAAIRRIAKPVVGYKICAAGRKPAPEAFAFALKHIRAKDGICVGVFPPKKADMIDEDAAWTRAKRKRKRG